MSVPACPVGHTHSVVLPARGLELCLLFASRAFNDLAPCSSDSELPGRVHALRKGKGVIRARSGPVEFCLRLSWICCEVSI